MFGGGAFALSAKSESATEKKHGHGKPSPQWLAHRASYGSPVSFQCWVLRSVVPKLKVAATAPGEWSLACLPMSMQIFGPCKSTGV